MKRFIIAQIKHETNSFSPIATTWHSFGHGTGPRFGTDAAAGLAGSDTPFAAFLDIAQREGAIPITPVAAESWPSAPCSRDTFERLVRPLEEAVRAGCDAVFLDLHGAMVAEGTDDAEGEIIARVRRLAPTVPIAVCLDYHTNLSAQMVANATVIAGYKTYPHVDIYQSGRLAGDIVARQVRGEIEPVMAWGWHPILPSIMRHAPEDGPSGAIIDYARAMEANGTVLAATLLPAFAHADTPYTGLSVVVVADAKRHGREGARVIAERTVDEMMRIAWDRRAEYVFTPRDLTDSVNEARIAGLHGAAGPVLLIDHCDNCGSGGAQDVMAVVAEIQRQGLADIAIAPIRDPQAVAIACEAGVGANVNLMLGGKTDMPSIGLTGKPLAIAARVKRITDGEIVFTGAMYTGVRSHLGRTVVLDTGRAEIVVTELHHEPFDPVIFRHCGIDPERKRYLMLKSRIHYRAGFKAMAGHIVECMGEGVTSADLSIYPYRKLQRPIFPLDTL